MANDYGEPWQLTDDGYSVTSRDGKRQLDYRRIPASVNACAGVDDPQPGELAELRLSAEGDAHMAASAILEVEKLRERVGRLAGALVGQRGMADRAKAAILAYLPPDSGISAGAALNTLIGVFDGPEQRAADAALSALNPGDLDAD